MSNECASAHAAAVRQLGYVTAEDEGLRYGLRALAEPILNHPQESGLAGTQAEQESTVESQVTVTGVEAQADQNGPLPILDIASAPDPIPFPPQQDFPAREMRSVTAGVVPNIEAHCRLKAEGARWAVVRQRLRQQGASFHADIAPKDKEILAKAAVADCRLWMNRPHWQLPADLSLMEDVAGCFEALADAISVVRQFGDGQDADSDFFVRSLDLVAEAQSALRVAIAKAGGPKDDEQHTVYLWLKEVAAERNIYIQRYMRINDPANPHSWDDIQQQIETLSDEFQDARRLEKQRRNRMNKVQYHAEQIKSGEGSGHDWTTIVDTVVDMVDDGIPASNREIRDALLPIIDDLPGKVILPLAFRKVLREIHRYLSTRSAQPEQPDRPPSSEVVKVARLLSKHSMVVIGGERRTHAYDALKKSLRLKKLFWVATKEHEPVAGFEEWVAKKDVKVVILAIRWSSHSFCKVARFCKKHGKPLVWLPGGYSPNQVAHQILFQCGKRLAV